MATLFGMFPFLKTLFADSGYQGPKFAKALGKVLPHLNIEIVKRSDRVSGFVVLPKRWIVERTIAWLNRCRRLAKDWENLNRKALAFLRLASIRLMLRKLFRTDSEGMAERQALQFLAVPCTRQQDLWRQGVVPAHTEILQSGSRTVAVGGNNRRAERYRARSILSPAVLTYG